MLRDAIFHSSLSFISKKETESTETKLPKNIQRLFCIQIYLDLDGELTFFQEPSFFDFDEILQETSISRDANVYPFFFDP